MIKYKKTYCTFFNYDYGDSIPCEVCKYNYNQSFDLDTYNVEPLVVREAVDIHHILGRKMGGSRCCNINEIPNLIAVCRQHHIEAEDNPEFNKHIRIIHLKNIIKELEK